MQRKVDRCGAVFDAGFYLAHNPDLVGVVPEEQAFDHFNQYGFRERRAYRYVVSATAVEERARGRPQWLQEKKKEDDEEEGNDNALAAADCVFD